MTRRKREFDEERVCFSHRCHYLDQRVERDCDGISVHASDTTRSSAEVVLNVPTHEIFSRWSALISVLHR